MWSHEGQTDNAEFLPSSMEALCAMFLLYGRVSVQDLVGIDLLLFI
jgi:hypothetical protein